MKNINSFIKSHCGFGGISSVSRRYFVLLTALLSLGVGQMWAAYYVTGSTATVGSWNEAGKEMTQVGTTSTYYRTFTNFNESNTLIKVTNGSWSQTWGGANIQSGADISLEDDGSDNHNIKIVGNPNKTITVWFNKANNKVWVTGAAYATQKVYFIGENSWTDSNVKAHVFLGDAAYYAWGSDQTMTKESTISRAGITYKVYSYTFPNGYKNVIFRYPSSAQTSNLTWNASTPYYSIELSAWFASTADALAKYLVGTNWTSASWDHTDAANKMTDNGDGSYSKNISISDATKQIALKISKKGTWTGAWGGAAKGTGYNLSQDFGTDGDGNLTFKVTHSGTTKITLTSAGKINVGAPYQVSYAAGTGATGSVSASAVTTYGSTCTLSSSTFSKSGYTQDGWATSDGGEKAYDLGASYTANANVTLYPHWNPNTYTITLNDNNGTGHTASVTATYNSSKLTSITNPTRDGYTFAGWYTNSDGTGIMVIDASGEFVEADGYTNSSKQWTRLSDLTLYARWKTNASVAAYNFQFGSGTYYSSSWTLLNFGEADNHVRTIDWTLIDPTDKKFYVGYGGDFWTAGINGSSYGTSEEKNLAELRLAPGNLIVGTATGAVGKLVINDDSSEKNLYVGFQPNGYGLTYNGNVKAFSKVDNHMWQTDIVTLTAADVSGSFKVGLATATSGTYVDCSTMTRTDDAAALNTRKNALVSEQSYPAIPDLAEGQEGRFVIWDNDTHEGKQWYLCFLPVYSITYNANGADRGTVPVVANKYRTNETPTVLGNTGTLEKAGYAFSGWNTEADGSGTAYAAGAPLAAIGSNVTLYAQFEKAQITNLALDAAVVAPGGSVGVTPTVAPTPTGTNSICWKLLYSNGNLYDPQPNFGNPKDIANKVTFNAPTTSGTYLVAAVLRTGSDCNGGTKLDSVTYPFQVAGDHNVTVQYKCGSTTIAPSTIVNGKPLAWSSGIAAPDIVGYTFHHWLAGDGITLSENGSTELTGERPDSSGVSPIYIKAIYDGKLTAVYNKKNMIYFNNTLGWDDVWVYFYTNNKYWAANYGTGAYKGKYFDSTHPYNDMMHGHMTQIEGTNIWYFDYTAAGYSTYPNVAFANMDKSNEGTDNTTNNDLGFFSNTTDNPIQVVRRGDHSTSLSMFVPVVGQEPTKLNNNKAEYSNQGYWMNYPENTGYTLKIYNQTAVDGAAELRSIPFEFTENKNMPMEVRVDLEADKTYGFKIYRVDDKYYGNNSTMTANTTNWAMTEKVGDATAANCGLRTTAAGDYIFKLNYFEVSNIYEYRVGVTYPVAVGDYQVLYKDNTMSKWFKSAIIPRVNETDTISFFVRKDKTPKLKLQKCTAVGEGSVTWKDTIDNLISSLPAAITKDSVYNFIFTKAANGKLQHSQTEGYTGNYYIRTDCAGATKWDNYKSADHMMTYSEYSELNSDFTHYFMSHVWAGTNVKYVVANDYSPNISDTLITSDFRGGDEAHIYVNTPSHGDGDIKAEANIRFMWNRKNNAVYRAYLAGGKEDGSKFLVLRGTDSNNIKDKNGVVLTGESKDVPGNNHGAGAHCMQFTDNENWIYETTVQVVPSSYVKLYASFNGSSFYYRGNNNDVFNDTEINEIPNAIQLITGSGDAQLVRVIYDFKTDRLLAAYLPSGEIKEDKPINADVMFIREHQDDIAQLTFSGSGRISKINTAYAVMRFNKWTLNNKSTEGEHLPLASPLSRYARDIYYVSFPFDVNLNEVFGFGTYGVHWIMEYYDGAARAANGFWKDTPTYWRFITNRNGYVLKKDVGYILALDLDELGEESSVWANNNERAELFFPSSGTMDNITAGSVNNTLPEHTCTIRRAGADRTKADSHWNIMSVPTYVNTDNIAFANTEWKTSFGPNFLYTWNSDDNTLTPTSATGFTYHAMHAYTVQYYGGVTWTTSVSVTPSPIVAREKSEPSVYEWCLELQQNEKMTDRTYVRMSDEEEVTSGFEFGYDMSKELNGNKASIYTFIGSDMAAGNSMPLNRDQTTVIPVGANIRADGEYTFAMPDGTSGVGVTLIDNVANTRTNLSALDYTVTLSAGEYTNRFFLEISPVQNTPTDIEAVSGQPSEVRKVMIDGILYIVRDGKMYDARGALVHGSAR